jgi:SAM-dependent methyltransferase
LIHIHQYLSDKIANRPIRYLDLGAGTGNLTIKLLNLGGKVISLDLSPRMIAVLQQKVSDAGFSARFTGIIGSADNLRELARATDLQDVDAVVTSSVLHHLHDYIAPFRYLDLICPKVLACYITHEPCSKKNLKAPNMIKRIYNSGLRRMDVVLSRRISRPTEKIADDPVADYHAFMDGVDEVELRNCLQNCELGHILFSRRYNMRRTTLVGTIDNRLMRRLRNDIFPVTMFAFAAVRE